MYFRKRLSLPIACAMMAILFAGGAAKGETAPAPLPSDDARHLMEESEKLHRIYPYVFEEQTMVLEDRNGNRTVRKLRRFSRVEEDGGVKFLLVFDHPIELRGVALLARYKEGKRDGGIYLPAFGGELKSSTENNSDRSFLGTDFSTEDLSGVELDDNLYKRLPDRKIDSVDFYVIEARPKTARIERQSGYSYRRHYMRKDNMLISRTEFFDRQDRMGRKLTMHDIRNVGDDIWRGNMILMENRRTKHKTLIKVNRRVYSHDYVPEKIFTEEWLTSNRHMTNSQENLFERKQRAWSEEEPKEEEIPSIDELEDLD